MKPTNLPLTNTAIGLDVGDDFVRVVVLQKFYNKVHLATFGKEEIRTSADSTEDTIAAIQGLFSRLKIKQKDVVIHLQGKGVRHKILESPFLPPDELESWIRQQIGKQLPSGLQKEQISVSYHILQQKENGIDLRVSYCQSYVVEQRLQVIEKAGLHPVMIGAGNLDFFQPLVFDGADIFSKSISFVKIDKSQITTLFLENGAPVFYQESNFDQTNHSGKEEGDGWLTRQINQVIAGFQQNRKQQTDKMILVNNGDDNYKIDNINVPLAEGILLKGLVQNGAHLPPEYSLAAGLALKKYYPLLNTIDLLPPGKKLLLKKNQEKKNAMSFILVCGTILFVILLGLNIFRFVMNGKLEQTQERLLDINNQVFALDQERAEQKKLQNALSDMQRLVTQRSQYARLLQEISRIVPEYTWLRELNCQEEEGESGNQKNIITMKGLAYDENRVAILLSRLEKSNLFSGIMLVSTTKLPAKEVWKRTQLKKIPLIHFEIKMEGTK